VLHKSSRFFWVAVVLCAGCAHKAAPYQKATGLSQSESGPASQAYYAPVERLQMSGAGDSLRASPMKRRCCPPQGTSRPASRRKT